MLSQQVVMEEKYAAKEGKLMEAVQAKINDVNARLEQLQQRELMLSEKLTAVEARAEEWWTVSPPTLDDDTRQPPPPHEFLMVEAPHPILGGTDQTRGRGMARLGTLRKRFPRAAARPTAKATSSGAHIPPLSIQWLLRNSGVTTDAGRTGALLVVASLEEHRARTFSIVHR